MRCLHFRLHGHPNGKVSGRKLCSTGRRVEAALIKSIAAMHAEVKLSTCDLGGGVHPTRYGRQGDGSWRPPIILGPWLAASGLCVLEDIKETSARLAPP